ncbi:DNA-binding domain-containing protein, AraC-type [Herbaspirillum sp. CF444]|nr:DNA-binding domain-containing protein, AraC-type [Herbaspirillum sp. CF444]
MRHLQIQENNGTVAALPIAGFNDMPTSLPLSTPKEIRRRMAERMVELLAALTPLEGYNLSPLPDVRFLRSNRPLKRMPVLYEPGIVIVAQGRKRGHLGSEVYLYDAQHYLAVSVPVPFSMETDASEKEPMLAIYLRLDFKVAAELMMQIDECVGPSAAKPRGMVSTPMETALSSSVLRFLEAMSNPLEAEVLGPSLRREIYFRVLTGQQGGSMRAALTMQGQFGKISRAISMIHRSYDEALGIEQLAREAGMSVPTFHAHFKTVTDTSPLQYLKSTRLHQARLLMLRNGMTAGAACAQVGYESASQFSREFKRLFGRTPVDEVERMRKSFTLPPQDDGAQFVSSH